MGVLWPHPAQGIDFHLKDGMAVSVVLPFLYSLIRPPTPYPSFIHSNIHSFMNAPMGLHYMHHVEKSDKMMGMTTFCKL